LDNSYISSSARQTSDLSSDIPQHANLQYPDVLVDRLNGFGWRERDKQRREQLEKKVK
jgi:hypothetical protein